MGTNIYVDNVVEKQWVCVSMYIGKCARVCACVVLYCPHHCGMLIYGNLQVKCPQR